MAPFFIGYFLNSHLGERTAYMNRDAAKNEIKTRLMDYLMEKGINPNQNFHCLNPEHVDRNPSMSYDRNHSKVHCFSCNANYDIFDLIGLDYGLSNFSDQFKKACEIYHIQLDEPQKRPVSKPASMPASTGPELDYRPALGFFLQAQKDLAKTDYPARRGLSAETCKRFKLGYCEYWKNPKIDPSKKRYIPASPRLIIPTGDESYLARDTRGTLTEKEKKYSKSKVGPMQLFNAGALEQDDEPAFIVEGEIDAMSIEELGHPAVALGTVSMVKAFLQYIEGHRPKYPVIIALDADARGQKAADELEKGLKDKLIFSYRASGLYTAGKDANENLLQGRDSFNDRLEAAQNEALNTFEEARENIRREYKQNSAAAYINDFLGGIKERANTPAIDTGFTLLNRVLDGGLYEGLYVIGAISSLGKTTFVLQAGDQIARAGQDVIIFSLEMARAELMAKSISRLTYELTIKTGGDKKNAKTARGITAGSRWSHYSQAELQLIKSAIQEYKEYAEHIQIYEGIGDITASHIREKVQKHISITGRRPVVVIDYLQILAPYDVRATDKQNTDHAVTELKRISRDYKIPVLAISSFNRENYKSAVDMQAFKESGAIEYSSDVLIGLQLEGAGDKDFNAIEAKRKNPRNVELVILKNRNGRVGDKIKYDYYPMFNYFYEDGEVMNTKMNQKMI